MFSITVALLFITTYWLHFFICLSIVSIVLTLKIASMHSSLRPATSFTLFCQCTYIKPTSLYKLGHYTRTHLFPRLWCPLKFPTFASELHTFPTYNVHQSTYNFLTLFSIVIKPNVEKTKYLWTKYSEYSLLAERNSR